MISIIIPAYNVQEYLRDCLESVLAQSYKDVEIIVVNDGSTDGTRAVAEEFAAADNRVRLINQHNGGLSVARNTGIDSASGEYLIFVDADDCLMPDAVQTLLNTLLATGSKIAMGAFSHNRTENQSRQHRVWTVDANKAVERILYQADITLFNNSAWGKIYSRDIIGDERFTPGIYFEDIEYFHRVFLKSDTIGVTDAVVYFYRQTPTSIIHTFSPKRMDVLKITDNLTRKFQYDASLLAAARDRQLSANFNIFLLLADQPECGSYKEVMHECWNVIKGLRRYSLFNRKVRLKNKIGIILSYGGKALMCMADRCIRRVRT